MLVGANELLMLAVVLIAGVGSGMAAKMCRLPSVTGQILVGILIGPSVLDLFGIAEDHKSLEKLQPITNPATPVLKRLS